MKLLAAGESYIERTKDILKRNDTRAGEKSILQFWIINQSIYGFSPMQEVTRIYTVIYLLDLLL